MLSVDRSTGEGAWLVRYPPGVSLPPQMLSATEELFVLDGGMVLGDVRYELHDYAYLPAGYARGPLSAPSGAVVLTWFDREPRSVPTVPDGAVGPAIERLATVDLPWDRTGLEAQIEHLLYARKNLRLAHDGSCRTYLLGGMPHGVPSSRVARKERHPHAEEMFLVSGDMPCSLGIMKTGAYFFRPPDIWHGLDCSLSGFLMIMRTPGSNRTVSEWAETAEPVLLEPPYRPELPSGWASYRGTAPRLVPDY
jgi:hypothetical protein